MGIALVLAFVGLLATAADDCPQCTPTTLCATHVAAQAAEIKEWKPKLRAKEAADRLEAVKKLAAVSAEHPSVPSQEAAAAIAGALADDANEVRCAAATALGEGLHPDVAVRALTDALKEVRKELAKSGGGKYGGGGGDDSKDPKAAERRKQREENTKFDLALVASLARLPDDRCVEVLSDLLLALNRRSGADLLQPVADALIKADTRPAIAAVIAKIKASPPGGGGKWGPDTTGKTLHDLLTAWAGGKGLTGMPAWDEKDPPDWEAWFAKNQSKVAAKLGKWNLERMREGLKAH
jgi:hypothetical protein